MSHDKREILVVALSINVVVGGKVVNPINAASAFSRAFVKGLHERMIASGPLGVSSVTTLRGLIREGIDKLKRVVRLLGDNRYGHVYSIAGIGVEYFTKDRRL